MSEPSFDEQLVVRERNPWLLGLAFAVALGGLALFVLSPVGARVAVPLMVLAAIGFLSLLRGNPVPILSGSRVSVTHAGLRVGDVAIPRGQLRDAQLVPLKGGKLIVRVKRRRAWGVDLAVDDKEQGLRLLRALGFDASQTVATFVASSRLPVPRLLGTPFATVVGLAPVAAVLGAALTAPLLEGAPEVWALLVKAFGVVVALLAVFAAIPSRVDVGADGVLITWLGRRTFLPLAEMFGVEVTREGFGRSKAVGASVAMKNGERVWICVGDGRWATERASALVERIREAREVHARGSVDTVVALLGRHSRSLGEWIRELRALGSGANTDLRTAPVSHEQLWRVVESHAAEPEARAAAAVALGALVDDEGKARLRVAVDAVADERLRVAVDAATGEDDEALEAALAEVTHQGERGGREE